MLQSEALPSLAVFGMDVSHSVFISFFNLFRRLLQELSNIYILSQMCILVCHSLCTLQSKQSFCAAAGKKSGKKTVIVTQNNTCCDKIALSD